MQRQKVLVIVGPTASGKSALGVELARRFRGEVISADSRQVYRGLDLGTGKVTKREMKGVPHHLLDVASPKRAFSAGSFERLARRSIGNIAKRRRLPIVVGGTGFYIDLLTGRIAVPEVQPNPALRKKLQTKSAAQLYAMLQKKDPIRAKKMDTPSERNNKARLIRALEIAQTGNTETIKASPLHDALWIGLKPDFDALKEKIRTRLTQRLKQGMIGEAKRLHAAGLSYKRMRELGLEYRSLARHLQGEITKDELIEELARDIARYAKKQIGYWKRNSEIQWFKPTDTKRIERIVTQWLR